MLYIRKSIVPKKGVLFQPFDFSRNFRTGQISSYLTSHNLAYYDVIYRI